MGLRDEINPERFKPEDKKFSVVHVDTFEPPGSEDAAYKMFEVDDLSDVGFPTRVGSMYFAYDQEGNGYQMPEELEKAMGGSDGE